MKLLQRYPWLIPSDGAEWVPVEATPIVEHAHTSFRENNFGGASLPIRSPWSRYILEFSAPWGVRSRIAVRLETVADPDRIDEAVKALVELNDVAPPSNPVVELIAGGVFESVARGRPRPRGDVFLGLDREGQCSLFYAEREEGYKQPPDGIWPDSLAGILLSTVAVLGFLNCKNVTVTDEPPPPPAVAKKRRKRGVPEIVYKQLVVDGRPITRGPGRETPEEADFRYHICRGHFADHREHGLFGKEHLRGVYWVPMHARGSKAHGEIVKDYSVRP